jgi:ribonuclease J
MENKTEIKFYSGTRTIGGTVVSVEYGEERIILDFGREYKHIGVIVDSANEKISNYVESYLRLGLLPKIDDFYSEKNIPGKMKIIPLEKSSKKTTVFISHLHLDHMQNIGLIDEKISVYMSEESLKLYEVLEKVGEAVIGSREYSSIGYNETVKFGEISVTALRVEHDVMGACAYLVETPDAKILYSGDLRLTGLHPEWTIDMANKASKLGTNILILESTTIGKEINENYIDKHTNYSSGEKDLVNRIIAELIQKSGIGLFNIYHRNVDRIKEFYEAAKKCRRVLVLELQTAYIAKMVLGLEDFYIIEDENVNESKLDKEVIDFYTNSAKISLKDINEETSEYLVQNSFHNLVRLLQINTDKGIYIHSNGIPLGDYDANYKAMKEFLNKLQLEYKYIGATGHANPEDLRYIAEKINPDCFIPVHGFYPENCHINCGVRFLPEEGKTYNFNGKNKNIYC